MNQGCGGRGARQALFAGVPALLPPARLRLGVRSVPWRLGGREREQAGAVSEGGAKAAEGHRTPRRGHAAGSRGGRLDRLAHEELSERLVAGIIGHVVGKFHSQERLCWAREPFPTAKKSFPTSAKTFPGAKETFPYPKQTFPTRKETFLTPRETFPRLSQTFLTPEQTFPTSIQTFPHPKETFPPLIQTFPTPKKTFPTPKKTFRVQRNSFWQVVMVQLVLIHRGRKRAQLGRIQGRKRRGWHE